MFSKLIRYHAVVASALRVLLLWPLDAIGHEVSEVSICLPGLLIHEAALLLAFVHFLRQLSDFLVPFWTKCRGTK